MSETDAIRPFLFESLNLCHLTLFGYSLFGPFLFIVVLKDLKYAESHEWVKIDGNKATFGITDHAQDHLGDVVYVELPDLGRSVSQGESFGAVESVKATSDINSPVSGKVVEVNEVLSESPGLVSSFDSWKVLAHVKDLNFEKLDSLVADVIVKHCGFLIKWSRAEIVLLGFTGEHEPV